MPYTVEVYKKDRRVKKGKGERLIRKTDHSTDDLATLKHLYETTYFKGEGFRMEYHKTFIERINLMSGLPFTERYDTPYHCSPSSESYWSM